MESLHRLVPVLRDATAAKVDLASLQQSAGNLTAAGLAGLKEAACWGREQVTKEQVVAVYETVLESGQKNSWQAAKLAGFVLTMGFPMFAAAPVFSFLGFGSAGPGAGTFASYIMSKIGVFKLYSIVQSASMGGYGVGTVSFAVRAVTAAIAFVLSKATNATTALP